MLAYALEYYDLSRKFPVRKVDGHMAVRLGGPLQSGVGLYVPTPPERNIQRSVPSVVPCQFLGGLVSRRPQDDQHPQIKDCVENNGKEKISRKQEEQTQKEAGDSAPHDSAGAAIEVVKSKERRGNQQCQ